MELFYSKNYRETNSLDNEQAFHCSKVLRHKIGDLIFITDGKGSISEAKLISVNPKTCLFHIINLQQTPPAPFKLHIAVSPTKNNNRLEWFLEKAAEIGISEITPILCKHTLRRNIQLERLNKIIISACCQSLNSFFPVINQPVSFNDFIKKTSTGQNFIAVCKPEITKPLKELYIKNTDALILIGPEGDFSDDELNLAINNDYQPVSLTNTRLRTETAALYSCALINILNQ